MSESLSIQAQIESILFFKGEPVAISLLSSVLKISPEVVEQEIQKLEEYFLREGRGIVLLRNGDKVSLGTTPFMHELIEALRKEELGKELGKAGLETLALVLYRGPISRAEINHIRGVNSNYTLRNLLVRGLIEKDESKGVRGALYKPTFELLAHMGITKIEDLPEYQTLNQEVATFVEADKEDTYEEDEVLDEVVEE